MEARKNPKKPHDLSEALRQTEERFESLIGLSSDWYWEQDDSYRFTVITGSNLDAAGVDLKQVLGTTRWDNDAVPVGDGGSWDKHKAALKARRPFSDFVYKRANPKGELHYFSVSGLPVFDGKGRFCGYRGVAKDITKTRRAEQLQALEHTVTLRLAEAENASAAMKSVIRAICETEDWECGRYFRVDEKAGVLRFAEAWDVPDAAIERYLAASRDTSASDTGLKKKVWRSGEPLWKSDTGKHARVSQGTIGGARDRFMFPVIAEGKTIGVLTFTSRKVREPDARLLQAVRVIGSQIGQFVRRKQAEDMVRESEGRFRNLTDLSSDFYWQTDAEHRLVQTQYDRKHRPVNPRPGRSGKTRWELPSTHPDAAGWAAHRATLEAHLPFRDFELARIDDDGVERYLSISGEPVFDAAGVFKGYRGVGKEITARRREEQLLNLEHAATRCLSEADRVSDALQSVIRTMCESQGWECGRYFYADEKAGVLRFGEAWGIPEAAIERYIDASRDATYSRDLRSVRHRIGCHRGKAIFHLPAHPPQYLRARPAARADVFGERPRTGA